MSEEVSPPTPIGLPHILASLDRAPEYDPEAGEHLWTWAVLYGATLGDDTPNMDPDNLLLISGPGCHHCGYHYTEPGAQRPCEGPRVLGQWQ